ncbi:hypothetical protein H4R34_005307 [Dimargaris verticillata]|uniref:Late embryogenesis abundant protein LEA-2 subgroup domain-containing protein n=1 Tax=Dimargaris verticillata TaxID=2761393 RepID=A0A9W8AZ43_9FUNG|nr:hypothetical protein H4R34_005307 [Dimargaris verticillata]
MPPGTHTDSMADNDSKFEHDGGSESPLKEAGADGQDPVPPPPANKPAKKTGLRRLMCCAPRKCVFWVFGLLLVLFLILFFSIPREPTVGVARINVIKDPVVTYNREDKDFGLDVRTNVTMRVKNNSFYPMTISSIKQKGYDSETFQYIGNGTVKSFTVGALTESYFNGTFTLSYHSSNQSSTVLNSLYSKCTPSALNDGHGGPKTGNIYLNIISEITMDSVKWLGMSPKSSSGVIIECPPE